MSELTYCQEVSRARPLGEKLRDRGADTIPDYLAARIWVDDLSAMKNAVAALKSRFEVLKTEDFLVRGKTGYRAIHIDVRASSGLSVEIQLIPSNMEKGIRREHAIYEKWRKKTYLTADGLAELESDCLPSRRAFEAAYEEWRSR